MNELIKKILEGSTGYIAICEICETNTEVHGSWETARFHLQCDAGENEIHSHDIKLVTI